MNYEDRSVVIFDKNNMNESSARTTGVHSIFSVSNIFRIRRFGAANRSLNLIDCNAVRRRMFNVPIDPAKVHDIFI